MSFSWVDWLPAEKRDAWSAGHTVNVAEPAELTWVSFDLDGTLAESVWVPGSKDSSIGRPIPNGMEEVFAAVARGYEVWIYTARPWSQYGNVKAWVRYWEVPVENIVCGKFLAEIHVDDRAAHSNETGWLQRLPDRTENSRDL